MTHSIAHLLSLHADHVDIKHSFLSDIPIDEDFLVVRAYSYLNKHTITTATIVDIVDDTYYHLHFADGKYGVYTLDYYNQPQLHDKDTQPTAPTLYNTTFYRVTDTQPPIIY